MSPTSNVRPFVPRKPAGPETSDWQPRLIAAVAYLALGYFLRIPSEGNINLIMVLGLLYWGLIHQRRQSVPFFLRFHLIQGLVLFLIITILSQVVFSVFKLLESTFVVLGLGNTLQPFTHLALTTTMFATIALTFGLGVLLAVLALLGKSLTLPVVTQQARSWA